MKDENMTLPKPKKIKLIKIKKNVIKKFRESLEEEVRYLSEKKLRDEDYLSSRTNHFS